MGLTTGHGTAQAEYIPQTRHRKVGAAGGTLFSTAKPSLIVDALKTDMAAR